MKQKSELRPGCWRLLRWCLRQTERCLAFVGLLTMIYLSCFQLTRITSGSMKPTLIGENWDEGDRILTEKISYQLSNPQRWELMTFRSTDGEIRIKRILGLPGERIGMLRGGKITINNELIHRPDDLKHLVYFPFGNLTGGAAVDCKDGYFVLGDDSKDSDDSRFNGPVKPKDVIGRAWCIYHPANRRQFLTR